MREVSGPKPGHPGGNHYRGAGGRVFGRSDNFEDKGPGQGTHTNQPLVDLYNWTDMPGAERDMPGGYWSACYEAIAAANHVLDAIANGNFREAKVRHYRGEALVARAYAHFMLVTLFAQAYEIGGANSSPGVPYVTERETVVLKQYDRETVAKTYEKIERDLLEGMPLLEGGVWKVPKYHFTPQSANAFAARFYLFKGEWEKVVAHVAALLPSNDFYPNIRQYAGNLYNLTYAEHRIEYTKAERPFNLLLGATYSTYHRASGFGQSLYGFGESKKNEWSGNTVYGSPLRNRQGSWGSASNYTPNKYEEYFHITNPAANIGLPMIMMPLFTMDEVLANRAEAYIQLGDYPSAIADMNTIGRSRIVNYNAGTHGVTLAKAKTFTGEDDDKQAMLAALLDTKKKMFMLEGIRWMDILRHKITVRHNHIASDATETFSELPHGDNRRMFQLPKEAELAGVLTILKW